ncbi:MAG: hypothetical protein CHACPFDD_02121 [Phycisphaerae bacterium]|nr:hypothetical protein [Phycisphaerae bacterium]
MRRSTIRQYFQILALVVFTTALPSPKPRIVELTCLELSATQFALPAAGAH